MIKTATTKMLLWLAILYTAASLLHFTHNAEFLDEYPNLPEWISRSGVYVSWVCIAAVGVLGYALFSSARVSVGLAVLAIYACLGFDGLLHYQGAPLAAHTLAMNASILFEAATALMLLIVVVRCAADHLSRATLPPPRNDP